MEKRNSRQPMEQTKGMFCTCDSGVARCQYQPVSHLANEFDVRSVMHGQLSLATVNQTCVIHEAMNGCKILRFIKGLFLKM